MNRERHTRYPCFIIHRIALRKSWLNCLAASLYQTYKGSIPQGTRRREIDNMALIDSSPFHNQKTRSTNTRVLVVVLVLSALVAFMYRDVLKSMMDAQMITDAMPAVTEKNTLVSLNANIDPQVRIKHFKDTALSIQPVTDKIGYWTTDRHRYHNRYGQFLLPLAAYKPNMKFMEIGLGCDMFYGPGASVTLWKTLFPPTVEVWEAEYNKACVDKALSKGQLEGIKVVTGDQGDMKTLDSWIEQTGGKFDAIIDDGGHENCQILNSFHKLWPELNPGGYYFIEDLQVGIARSKTPSSQCTNVPVHEYIADWQKQLLYITMPGHVQPKYPLPKDLLFIHCIAEACVFHKQTDDVNNPAVKKD